MRYIFAKKNLLALIFIAIGVYLLRETYAERVVFFTSPDELGPMTYPRYLLWGWLGLSVLYLVIPRKPFDAEGIKDWLPILTVVIASIAAYIFLFKTIGLFLSTFCFLLLFFYILNYRDPKRMLVLASTTAVVIWVIFEKLLAIPMPGSILGKLFG
jgi:hypothetical protein